MKKNDIWAVVAIVLVLVFLASGIIKNPISEMARNAVASIQKYWSPAAPPKTDMPVITQDEACAQVYKYLETKGSRMTLLNKRLEFLDWLGKCRPLFTATYRGNGKWQVQAMGNKDYGNRGLLSSEWGLWYTYEKSGIIEPANNEAQELLNYIQYYTR